MNLEDAFLAIWSQALVDNTKIVTIDDQICPVKRTSKNRLREVDFQIDGQRYRGLEQNPETSSRWAQMAREGKKVMQFLSDGHYIAVVADGKVFTYSRKQ